MTTKAKMKESREGWIKWLESYGAGKFYDAFMSTAQNARGSCRHCGEQIYLDIAEGGGVPDWKTMGGDYGCSYSPDTNAEGCGGHSPRKLEDDKDREGR